MFHNEDVLDSKSTKKWDLLLVIDVIEHVEDIFNFLGESDPWNIQSVSHSIRFICFICIEELNH